MPEPTWQGLTDLQMVRMQAAADQLLILSKGANQWPKRDFALFHVLYVMAMRVTELIQLDFDQYDGRYLTMLRKVREETGVEFAIEYAGHVSEKYIRRYTMPSEQETEAALEELFGYP